MARISVIVSPGAVRTELAGRHGDGWKARVAAPPERGRANDALVELLADVLAVPKSSVRVVSGLAAKKKVVEATHVPGVLAVMATAGLYDDSGKWLFHAGLPAKSGVGGGLIAVSPGKFGIAAFSPPLDAAGNSVRAQKAIMDVSNALGGNPYAPKPK